MAKQILFGEDVTKNINIGAKVLRDAVATTLGPRGRNVGIDLGFATWIIHDGVEVAGQVELKDFGQNFAVRVLRETANKQVAEVGDGTTVSIILAYALLNEAIKATSTGTNPMALRKGLEEGRDVLLSEIRELATPIKTKKQAVDIATISAEDAELGKQIGELIFKLGLDGVVTVEESKSPVTSIEQQDGMEFDQGYFSPYFITDPIRAEATIEDTFVFVTDKNINNINELLPLFQKMEAEKLPKNIVFISPQVTDSALATLIVNKARGAINVSAVKAPYQGQQQKDFLMDIAIMTGATLISSEAAMKFEETTLEMLGQAQRITSTKDATLIVGGKGDPAAIKNRIDQLRAEQERDDAVSDYQREKIRERIAKLTNGIAVISVGGATEVEIKERLERAKDAKEATFAALREGLVPGGEIIYLRARDVLKRLKDGERNIAYDILYNALEQPFAKLLQNAGLKPDAFINQIQGNQGIDVLDGSIKDMVDVGIIDPALVAIEAITNAVSTAIQLMTTDCLILPEPKKEDKSGAGSN